MKVITYQECGTNEDEKILCTEGPYFNIEQRPCALNDGSALAYFVNNTWVQNGISSVPSFCDSIVNGYFTKVSDYINWIAAIAGVTPYDFE